MQNYSENYVKNKEVFSPVFLGNREIRKPALKIAPRYIKYYYKQIAQYALTVGTFTDNELEKRRLRKKFKLAEFNLKLKNNNLLKKINSSLCSCGRDTHFNNEDKIIDFKEFHNIRRLSGLKSCGNNASCPVCASKLSAIRSTQLKELMSIGRDNNRSYILVVITLPHKPKEPLEKTLNYVIDMSRYIFNSKEWKKFKSISCCRFVHGGLENMVSFKNGLIDWHPHKNYLLDFDFTIDEVLKRLSLKSDLDLRMYLSRLLTTVGQRFLNNKKIDKELLKPFFIQNEKNNRIIVKGGVSVSTEFSDDYISKWGLDAEMTASIYKKGRFVGSKDKNDNLKSSFHPFGLLSMIDKDNNETSKDFKYQCVMAFQEFVLASRGKWWFYFGRGSISFYNENYGSELQIKNDDIELISLDNIGDIFYSLSYDEWLFFEPTSLKIAIMFSLPTHKDIIEYVFEEIEKNRIKIAEKYNCKISSYVKSKFSDP